jgi:hypothetical protein
MRVIRVFSSGGGVQSTAALVLSATGKIDYPIHVFANVGNRAESRQTIDYVKNVLVPYANANGIRWVEVAKRGPTGASIDLLDKIESSQKSIPIPVRMTGSGAPGNRGCTVDWKIEPVAKFLKELIPPKIVKAVSEEAKRVFLLPESQDEIQREYERCFADADPSTLIRQTFDPKIMKKIVKAFNLKTKSRLYFDQCPIVLGKGISVDEAQRAKKETGYAHYQASYPLIDLGLTRMDCHKIIDDAGLPPAPKSSCWFCPYKTKDNWQSLHDADPNLFAEAVTLEKLLHSRSVALGRGGCFFTSTGTTKSLFLDQVISPHYQQDLFHGFDDGECESGYCWT